jgi:hypothetical protein
VSSDPCSRLHLFSLAAWQPTAYARQLFFCFVIAEPSRYNSAPGSRYYVSDDAMRIVAGTRSSVYMASFAHSLDVLLAAIIQLT